MKELLGNSSNLALIPQDDGKLLGVTEIILIVTEPIYEADSAGEIVKRRITETLRFNATAKSLRAFVKRLEMAADAAEEAQNSFVVSPQDNTQG